MVINCTITSLAMGLPSAPFTVTSRSEVMNELVRLLLGLVGAPWPRNSPPASKPHIATAIGRQNGGRISAPYFFVLDPVLFPDYTSSPLPQLSSVCLFLPLPFPSLLCPRRDRLLPALSDEGRRSANTTTPRP